MLWINREAKEYFRGDELTPFWRLQHAVGSAVVPELRQISNNVARRLFFGLLAQDVQSGVAEWPGPSDDYAVPAATREQLTAELLGRWYDMPIRQELRYRELPATAGMTDLTPKLHEWLVAYDVPGFGVSPRSVSDYLRSLLIQHVATKTAQELAGSDVTRLQAVVESFGPLTVLPRQPGADYARVLAEVFPGYTAFVAPEREPPRDDLPRIPYSKTLLEARFASLVQYLGEALPDVPQVSQAGLSLVAAVRSWLAIHADPAKPPEVVPRCRRVVLREPADGT